LAIFPTKDLSPEENKISQMVIRPQTQV